MSGADKKQDPQLVGETSEVEVSIEGVKTKALYDTGSCVSTIGETFYKQHLSNKELKPLENILRIECADGGVLPYLGFIEADLMVTGIPKSKSQTCLFLVVRETDYNKSTPLLLGTNILKEFLDNCRQEFGPLFLQKAALQTPWFLAFRCMVVRDRELRKNKDKLAIIRSASDQKVLIKPNQTIHLQCVTTRELSHHPTCAIITDTEEKHIYQVELRSRQQL